MGFLTVSFGAKSRNLCALITQQDFSTSLEMTPKSLRKIMTSKRLSAHFTRHDVDGVGLRVDANSEFSIQ